MNIHNGFVDQVLLKRKAALRDLIVGENSLHLSKLKPDIGKLIDELDRIFYTIEFLEKENLIKTRKFNNSYVVALFDGFELVQLADAKYTIHFWMEKLQHDDYSLEIEMRPGLMAFKNNKYKTDEQIKEKWNFWLPILVGMRECNLCC